MYIYILIQSIGLSIDVEKRYAYDMRDLMLTSKLNPVISWMGVYSPWDNSMY